MSSETEAASGTAAVTVSSGRYRATLVLFAVVAAALVLWFQRHVEPFVTETLIVGGTMSLWGVWKLVWSMYEDAGGKGRVDWTRRLLGGRGALRALAFVAIVVLILHLWTSSIYLRYGGALPGEGPFKVQVLESGSVFIGPFDLEPGQTVGRPMFPRFRTLHLTYEITSPRGFLPEQADLASWSAHDYRVPGDFTRKKLHVLRFVPGRALYSELPKPDETGGDSYYCELRANGRSVMLDGYKRGILVTGVTKPDLPDASSVSRDLTVRQELEDHFAHAEVDNPGAIVSALMEAPALLLPSAELATGDEVEVEIGTMASIDGQRKRNVVVTCRLQVPASGGRHTFFVGPDETEVCK